MTRGLSASDLGKWKNRISAAKQFFTEKLAESDEIVAQYQRRNAWSGQNAADHGIRRGRRFSANFVWANLQVLLPSVYAGTPRVLVKPRSETEIAAARSQEKWFNYTLQQISWRHERRSAIRSAFLRGYGVNKLGWKPQAPGIYRSAEEPSPFAEPRSGVENIPAGSPFVKHISPFHFLADPEYNLDLDRCRWVAHRVRRPVEEIKGDPAYRNAEELKGGMTSSSFARLFKGRHDQAEFEDQQLADIYEIWIRDLGGVKRKLLVLSDELDEPLRFEDWPYTAVESFPFDVIQFHEPEEDDDSDPMLPIPECRAWMPLQKAVNLLLSKSITHVDRFDRVFGINTQMVESPEGVQKAVLGGDGSYFEVTSTDDVRKAVMAMDWGSLPPEVLAVLGIVKTYMDEVSGIGDIQRGSALASTAATVGAIQQQNAALRSQDRRAILAQADRRALRLMKQIAQEFLTEEILVPISGFEGRDWVHVTPDQIRAELDVEIDMDSIAPESIEARKGRWVQALQLVGPLLNSPSGVPAGVRELLRRTLHDLGFEDEALFLPPLSTLGPEDEHQRWLLGETPVPHVSPADDDGAHLAGHEAFLSKYGARLEAHQIAVGPNGEVISARQVVEAHIQDHKSQMAQKRAQGGISVRGNLAPVAGAPGSPGGMTGAPPSEFSLRAPEGIGA